MYHNLQLATVLDAAGAANVTAALRAIAGVDAVQANAGTAQVNVLFDGEKTSPQEIETVAARSGFAPRAKQRQGGCCGGCCGS